MDKLFQSKWFIRIISLALSITLYIFVTVETNVSQNDSRIPAGTTNETQVLEEVPLEIKIDSDQYVVSGVPEQVKVTLEGKLSLLMPIVRQLNFNVFVDLRNLSEGEHTVEVEHENLPDNITAYIEPKTIDVVIEKRTAKEFTVDVDLVNEDKLPLGYELGTPEIHPETVTIISSEAVIEQIAMVKVFIDVTDLKESIRNRELPISVYDIQGNDLNVRVEPASIMVSLAVERPSKKVPLNILTRGELPDGLELDSMEAAEEIEIFGKREVLSQINEINTKELNLNNINQSDQYELDIEFPDGVIANDETIDVKIELLKTKNFNDISVDVEITNSDYTFVDPEEGKIAVLATGSDKLINQLKKSDIRAFIKVDDLTEGRQRVELSLEGPKNIKLESETKRVTITIP